MGSFSIDMTGGWKSDFAKTVKHQLSRVDTKVTGGVEIYVGEEEEIVRRVEKGNGG